MNKYQDTINSLKDQLQNLLTAENTDTITKAVSTIDELEKIHQETVGENSNLKNKIVEIVKGTTFKQQSESKELPDDSVLTVEEACRQAEKELLQNRKEN